MPCQPLNKHLLWKSSMERSQHPRLCQPPMNLPNINSLTGHFKDDFPPIRDQLSQKTANESIAYWKGVEHRKLLYRIQSVFDPSRDKERWVHDTILARLLYIWYPAYVTGKKKVRGRWEYSFSSIAYAKPSPRNTLRVISLTWCVNIRSPNFVLTILLTLAIRLTLAIAYRWATEFRYS